MTSDSALKGQQFLAQGRAKRHPGFMKRLVNFALKGQHLLTGAAPRLAAGQCLLLGTKAFALSGRIDPIRHIPRALPWASVLLPFQGAFISFDIFLGRCFELVSFALSGRIQSAQYMTGRDMITDEM